MKKRIHSFIVIAALVMGNVSNVWAGEIDCNVEIEAAYDVETDKEEADEENEIISAVEDEDEYVSYIEDGFQEYMIEPMEESVEGTLLDEELLDEDILEANIIDEAEEEPFLPGSLAGEINTSGSCGENVFWMWSGGVLAISGSGSMYNYEEEDELPYSQFFSENYSTSKIVIGEGITHIGALAFRNHTATSISLPSTVTTIGESAFEDGRSLKEVAIPNGVALIDDYAFSGSTSLKTLNLGSGLKSIGDGAFELCFSLKETLLS